jgi:hypothetical protein
LVVEDELLLILFDDFVVLQVVSSQFLDGVLIDIELGGTLRSIFHIFVDLFIPFEYVLVAQGYLARTNYYELVTKFSLPVDNLFRFKLLLLEYDCDRLKLLVAQFVGIWYISKDSF